MIRPLRRAVLVALALPALLAAQDRPTRLHLAFNMDVPRQRDHRFAPSVTP